MQLKTKHRIVGAIVVLALAVIFLPIWLQGPKSSNIDTWKIPTPPKAPAVTPPAVSTVTTTTSTPAQTAWSLQLGSFTHEANANKLAKRLQTKGFAAYTQKTSTNGKDSFKVLVGPEVDKAVLAQQAQEIQKTFKINSTVVAYTPNGA